jgi:alkaline phosphatase
MYRIFSYLSILSLSLFSFCSSSIKDNDEPEVKNIILLIGDGMGTAHVYSAMSVSKDSLNIEKMPVSGFSKTNSSVNYITDSAAGGTAIATGKKTKNGVISQSAKGEVFKTILEIAEEYGLSTGLISTSTITHATPASFIAHDPNRNNLEDIAYDFLSTDIDVFIGGGYDHFAKRKDSLNLIDSLRSRNYQVLNDMKDVTGVTEGKLAGLVATDALPSVVDGRGTMLPDATSVAIDILSKQEKGFFLMVEGSQIDWAAHGNNQESTIAETLDFDKAVGKALEFARKNGNTLVIVTADHETGGMTITGGELSDNSVILSFSSGNHTATMVPVFAFGPGAEEFSGIMDNTQIFDKMLKLYNFGK